MGKENKNVKKNKVKYQTTEQTEIKNFVIVLLVVILCVGAIYLATRLFITKDLFKEEKTQTEEVVQGTVNYDIATMGMIMNRPYKEYYVAIFDNTSTSSYYIDMATLVATYSNMKDVLPIYTVDLANSMNDSYYDPENVNVNAKTLSEVKVGDITLIKVKNGKISKYIVDYAKMQDELGIDEK